MIGRLHLKIVFSIVLLFGLVASQSGLAKGAHTQHTGASAKGAIQFTPSQPKRSIPA